MRLPTLREIQARKCVLSLAEFVRYGWEVLEPTTPLVWNWHIEAVCAHLQALLEDWMAWQRWNLLRPDAKAATLEPVARMQNLLINIPPGTAKSRLVAVFAPAWMWLHWPSFRAIFLTSNPRVAIRDSMFCRQVVESEWYREWFEPPWGLADDQNAKSLYYTSARGMRMAVGFNSRITGDRADAIVWDDPHDADEVKSENQRKAVLDRYDDAIGNRVNDLAHSIRIGIMQRLHEADLSGHVLSQGGWEHLCLPMEYVTKRLCKCHTCARGETAIGWKDPRTTEGELLMPQRFPVAVLASERVRLGSMGYAGQMQQHPAPAEGVILKRPGWRYYLAGQLPEGIEEWCASWDMTFKDTQDSDFVCGQMWARKGANKYLVAQIYKRMGFSESKAAVVGLHQRFPQCRQTLVEDAANGPAVLNALQTVVPGLIAMKPAEMGSKVQRAWAVQPEQEAGNFWLPALSVPQHPGSEPVLEPWVEDFIEECALFPGSAHDDRVDAFTQMGIRMMKRRGISAY